jgi:hypothetical protein
VHTYAREPYHNIIINDLMDYAVELLEYRYDIPMYLYRDASKNDKIYNNATLNGKKTVSTSMGSSTLDALPSRYFETLVNSLVGEEVA